MHSDDATEELGWLAFRYISNEMSPAEVESFERRLVNDQLAREAVAQAVIWTEAVASGQPKLVSRLAFFSTRSIRWFAAAAAGIAAMVMVVRSARNSIELKTLARSFAEQMGPDTFSVTEVGPIAEAEDPDPDDEAEWTVPVWMIEAVGASSSGAEWEDI
jgi:hypothetical protein